jgi:MFS transporter, DHA1 family, inner membrane transport protein
LVSPSEAPAATADTASLRVRWIVLAMALAAFALNLNTHVMGALMPFLGDGGPLGLGKVEKTWLLSAAGAASALGALLAGPLADRRGRRGPLLGGLLLFTVASAGHVLADSYAVLFALRLVAGAGVGVAYAAASAMVADVVPYARRGAAMGVFTAGMFLAVPAGLPLAVWFASSGDWHDIFWVQAGVGMLALALAAWLVPWEPPLPRGTSPFTVLSRPGVVAVLLATMLHVGSFFTTVQLAGDWMNSANILPKASQWKLWIVLGSASAIGSLALGRLGDRVGKYNFVLLTSVLLVACLVWLGQVDTLAALWPAGLVLAVVAAARTGPLQALVSGLSPRHEQATLMGMRAAAQQAGVFLFAIGAGPLYDTFGFKAVVVMAGACQALSYVAIRLGVKEHG